MKVYVYKDEWYPFFGLTTDAAMKKSPYTREIQLNPQERTDLARVQREWEAWQEKLAKKAGWSE